MLFAALIVQGILIALRAPDLFGSMMGIGIMGQIGWQVFCNVGVVTNTIPNTGISLPFFSSGGTSLLMLLGEMGIMLSISPRGQRPHRGAPPPQARGLCQPAERRPPAHHLPPRRQHGPHHLNKKRAGRTLVWTVKRVQPAFWRIFGMSVRAAGPPRRRNPPCVYSLQPAVRAGHINPALAIAGALKAADPAAEIHFAGRREGMEYGLVARAGYPFHHIEINGFQRRLTPENIRRNLLAAWHLAVSGPRCAAILREGKARSGHRLRRLCQRAHRAGGGKRGIHTAIHEQNAFPGRDQQAAGQRGGPGHGRQRRRAVKSWARPKRPLWWATRCGRNCSPRTGPPPAPN